MPYYIATSASTCNNQADHGSPTDADHTDTGSGLFLNGLKYVEPFPFKLDWEHAKDKAFCVLHT